MEMAQDDTITKANANYQSVKSANTMTLVLNAPPASSGILVLIFAE